MSQMINNTLRKVIALNNIGVSLLEKRCYFQALVTLKDAVTLLKLAAQYIDDGETMYSCNFAETKYIEAARRFASPIAIDVQCIEVECFSYSETQYLSTRSIFQKMAGSSLKFNAVRFEDVELAVCLDPDSFMLESAILMQNLGMAYFAMSTVISFISTGSATRHTDQREDVMLKYRNAALTNFHLSQKICERLLLSSEKRLTMERDIYYILALILGNRVRASFQQAEADSFESMLSKVQAVLIFMEGKNGILSFDQVAAAAA